MDYKNKYIKYKTKYLELKNNNLIGGSKHFNIDYINNIIEDLKIKSYNKNMIMGFICSRFKEEKIGFIQPKRVCHYSRN